MLRHLFFIIGNKTKYVSFGYQPLMEFGVIRRRGSKSIIHTDEQVYTLAECLTKAQESMCKGKEEEKPVIRCESGSRGVAAVWPECISAEYIRLTPLDLQYLARIFHVVQQYLRVYLLAMLDLLSYVTMSLTSVLNVEPMPNASTQIDYPHLYEELVTFV